MEVRQVRTDEIRLMKEDRTLPHVRYFGRSDSFLAADSDPIWQIMRVVKEGPITTTTYANKGSFTARWSDRETYFSPVTVNYAAFEHDMSASVCTDAINLGSGAGMSLQAIWESNNAADGSILLQSSVDGDCWCDYPDGLYIIPLTDGCKIFDIPDTSLPYFRVCYDRGSNTQGLLSIAYSIPGQTLGG